MLTPDIKYDSQDFAPIGPTAHSPAVIVARKDFPAKDLREFVAYLKQHGSAVKQAHGGIGASSHMACLLFTSEIGAKPTLVAYRGSVLGMNDMIGGHVDFLCEQSVSVSKQVAGGTVKAYGISADERLAALPDVPTAKEAGVNYQMSIWAGIFAPRGTPQPIVAKLSDALDKALDDPSVRKRIGDLGGSIPDKAERSPSAFDAYVKAEVARWAPILKAASPAGEVSATLGAVAPSPQADRSWSRRREHAHFSIGVADDAAPFGPGAVVDLDVRCSPSMWAIATHAMVARWLSRQ